MQQKSDGTFSGDTAVLIEDDLEDQSGAVYLRRIRIVPQSNGLQIVMGFSPTTTFAIGSTSDTLVPAWEEYVSAIGFYQGGVGISSIPGPNHEDNVVQDTTEVYNWRLPLGGYDY